MHSDDSLVGQQVTMACFTHIFKVKEVIFDTVIDNFVVRLELLSGAPIGIFPIDQIRIATNEEKSVGHRLDGESNDE